ncbi:MAG: FdhF/YdeP family oxidoreductase [Actinomycetota bacterium]|nr:FdhF/YdeP family oxidoreductase [Actinomycetota bacterium]
MFPFGTKAPRDDIDERDLEVKPPKSHAGGVTAVAVSMKRAVNQMGPVRTAKTLLKLNQTDGFDCQSCAWADPLPGHRHTAEFCENGAKAVAEEATLRRVTPKFFAEHSVADLAECSEYWLGQQGRITEPVVKLPGATHYTPIDWDGAFRLVAEHLHDLDGPDEAAFYTSGRASNEVAFAYQLFARAYGTNNLPDCSNMCHESTSMALAQTIGIGKASVSLQDVHDARLIVITGNNPGTNHPRMLSALEEAKRNGATIVSINPIKEAGLVNFRNPQRVKGWIGTGQDLADLHLPIRINGDLALWQAIGHLLVTWDDESAGPDGRGTVLDHDFIQRHTVGFDEWRDHVRDLDWAAVERASGLTREQVTELTQLFRDSDATVVAWAMGITQHRNAVATIKEFVNVAFAQGNIGKPGAGLLPVRGHSNVQGDRTMGIWERPPPRFLDSLQDEFGFDPPREHGCDTVDSIRAMDEQKVKVFVGLGGNFAHAAPDTQVTERALRKTRLSVQVSTKLNRSHLVCGETALILPTLGRTEKDVQATGEQFVTTEDTMCNVHSSRGPLPPAGKQLRSEVAIVTGIAQATLGDRYGIDWQAMREDYRVIRRHIANVVPGCAGYEENVKMPGGFILPHPPRDSRSFPTEAGAGVFTTSPIDILHVPEGRLLLQTLRSHDQFNTTIYGLSDRYRGIENGRRVVFVNAADITDLGLADGQVVDLVSEWTDGSERRTPAFRVVAYDTPRGCAAAYYPETNPLVPLDSTAVGSNCPTSKSLIVRLEPAREDIEGHSNGHEQAGADEGHKSRPEPLHLS